MKTIVLPLIALLLIVFCSCNKPEQGISKAEMRKIVESRNIALGECFKSGDAEKVATMYADSAKLSPNGSSFVHGRDNIKALEVVMQNVGYLDRPVNVQSLLMLLVMNLRELP